MPLSGNFSDNTEVASQPLSALSKPLPLWNKIWRLPALGALVILGLFAVFFKYKEAPARTAGAPKAEAKVAA